MHENYESIHCCCFRFEMNDIKIIYFFVYFSVFVLLLDTNGFTLAAGIKVHLKLSEGLYLTKASLELKFTTEERSVSLKCTLSYNNNGLSPDSALTFYGKIQNMIQCTCNCFSLRICFSKYGQTRGFLWTYSHLLKKSLLENFIFRAVTFVELFMIFGLAVFVKTGKGNGIL